MLVIAQVIQDIIKREGGFVNNPLDHGGPTKFGITLVTLQDWRNRHTTEQDVKELTIEEAENIYLKKYYLAPSLTLLPETLQPQVLDIAVNSGPSRAFKLLQETVNTLCLGPIAVDGKLGPMTKRKAGQLVQLWGSLSNDALADQRILYLVNLAVRRVSNLTFLRGWINRALEFKTYYMGDTPCQKHS